MIDVSFIKTPPQTRDCADECTKVIPSANDTSRIDPEHEERFDSCQSQRRCACLSLCLQLQRPAAKVHAVLHLQVQHATGSASSCAKKPVCVCLVAAAPHAGCHSAMMLQQKMLLSCHENCADYGYACACFNASPCKGEGFCERPWHASAAGHARC